MTPTVAVIVSTYNNIHGLESCFLGLEKQTQPAEGIYVADDGSRDDTRELVERYASRLPITHVWHPDDGFRLSEIRNKAVARTREDYLVFLDGDSIPHPRFVEDHRSYAKKGVIVLAQRCAIEGFQKQVVPGAPSPLHLVSLFLRKRILNDNQRWGSSWRMRWRGLLKGLRLPRPVYRPCTPNETRGGNLGVWREDLMKVNGFDEAFKGWGHEDLDFVHRLARAGVEHRQLLFRAICYHIDHPVNAENTANALRLQDDPRIRCEVGIDRHLMAE